MVPFLLSLWSFPPVAPLLGLVGVTCSYDAHRAAATRVHQKQQTACGRCAKHRPAPLSRRVICGHATSVWIVVGLLGFVRRDCMQRNMVEVPLIPVKSTTAVDLALHMQHITFCMYRVRAMYIRGKVGEIALSPLRSCGALNALCSGRLPLASGCASTSRCGSQRCW